MKGCHKFSPGGFSLIEVVLALGIVAFALVAILGMIPIGLEAMRSSVEGTTSNLIMQDIRARVEGLPFKAQDLPASYYDQQGMHAGAASNAYYKVDVRVASPLQSPTNAGYMAVVVTLAWPVQADGSLPVRSSKAVSSFYVTPLTGPGWQNIDTNFVPLIDF